MTVRTPERRQVAGLPVVSWPGTTGPVLALPGLGSPALSFGPVADLLPDVHLLAPDLRGRGDAQGMTGPTGLLAHARDVAGVLAELDLTDVVVVGHSMGAYLAPVVARLAPGRVRRLVLVDGGIRPDLPFFMRPALVRATFRRELGAMNRDWPSVDAVVRKTKLDRVLADRPELRPVFERVLRESSTPTLRPRVDVARAAEDAADTFFGTDAAEALDALAVPAEVFLAQSKKWAGQGPFISDRAAARAVGRQPLLQVQRLAGNHLTVLFAPEVLAAVAR